MHEYCPASGKYERRTVRHCIITVWFIPTRRNAAKGSACSQFIGAPHDVGRTFSGNDSGTATNIKKTSRTAIAVASATTKDSEYLSFK